MPAGTAFGFKNHCSAFGPLFACFGCAKFEGALTTIRIPEATAARRRPRGMGAGYFIGFYFSCFERSDIDERLTARQPNDPNNGKAILLK